MDVQFISNVMYNKLLIYNQDPPRMYNKLLIYNLEFIYREKSIRINKLLEQVAPLNRSILKCLEF